METRREATATRIERGLDRWWIGGGRVVCRFHGARPGWKERGKKRADFFQGRPTHRPHRPPTMALTRAHKALDGWVATSRCRNPHGYEWPPVEGPARTCLRTHGSSPLHPLSEAREPWMIFPSVMTEETARNNECPATLCPRRLWTRLERKAREKERERTVVREHGSYDNWPTD